ncbi:hypothetical protein AWM79_05725 [Pseudomonas agarici]|uniref:Uncharacterized protein n=1 Tax=Pseudomonas agarici TaxID=46677 RepID=A0A0X1SYB7_PSEAA|nr:hypothetical protein AWM79_05725 [Pseudomonas agarici]
MMANCTLPDRQSIQPIYALTVARVGSLSVSVSGFDFDFDFDFDFGFGLGDRLGTSVKRIQHLAYGAFSGLKSRLS